MRFKFCLIIVYFHLLSSWACAAQPPEIIVVGDSISAAYNMEISQSWPSLLQTRLKENGYIHQVFNSSIAGDTTQGGLARLPRLLEKHNAAVIIIELGGNDGLRGLPIELTRKNLSTMIEMSQAAGAAVLLAEMRIPPNYGMSYTGQFNGTYPLLKEKYDVTLIPFLMEKVALDPALMQADGIHPSVDAQAILLNKVWTVLESELEQ